jgi:hypothetical protein
VQLRVAAFGTRLLPLQSKITVIIYKVRSDLLLVDVVLSLKGCERGERTTVSNVVIFSANKCACMGICYILSTLQIPMYPPPIQKQIAGSRHHSLSRSYYYLRRRSPGPPFPPDHRQAGERGAIITGKGATVDAPRFRRVLNSRLKKRINRAFF